MARFRFTYKPRSVDELYTCGYEEYVYELKRQKLKPSLDVDWWRSRFSEWLDPSANDPLFEIKSHCVMLWPDVWTKYKDNMNAILRGTEEPPITEAIKIITPKRERAVCIRCKRKRFTNEMTLLFKHPLINPKGVYACTEKHWKFGKCIDQVKPEILMYAETGLFQLKPAGALL